MTSEESFLQAIRDAPDDDELRLVFADWLEEHDDPHGELMRLEVALARLDGGDDRRQRLEARSRKLRREHRDRLIGPWVRRLYDWGYPRGLLSVAAHVSGFFPLGPEVAHLLPWIERLKLAGVNRSDGQALARLWQLPHLTALDLRHNHLGPEAASVLVELPNLVHLRRLCLWGNALGDAGAATLLRSSRLERLTALDLSRNGLTAETARHIARAEHLSCLESLDLRGSALGAAGVAQLASAAHLGSLRQLYLGHCVLGDEGVRAQAEGTLPPAGLRQLLLEGNRLGPEAVSALAGSAFAESLEELTLTDNPLGAEGAVRLSHSPLWPGLRSLSLFHCQLGDEGVLALARAGPTALTDLDLGENGLGPRAARALANSPLLAGLSRLGLNGNLLGDEGARLLAESPNAVHLRELHLEDNNISDVGAVLLGRSPYLRNLRSLHIDRNPIRRAGQAALRYCLHILEELTPTDGRPVHRRSRR